MDTKHIKVGETYLLPVTVTTIDKKGWIEVATCNDYEYRLAPSETKTLLQSIIKNIEPAPKYDPCRKFRKGDVAEISRYKGRAIIPVDLKVGDKVKVCENEKAGDSVIHVIDPIGRRFFVNPAFLELVTAVEELKPYSVTYDNKFYHINKNGEEASIAVYSEARHPNAKAAAEAERDRLNAKFRKEQN